MSMRCGARRETPRHPRKGGATSRCVAVLDAGCEPVQLGALERSREFDVGTPVYNTGMSGSALRRHFGLG